MAMPSRKCQRLITLNNATSITPINLLQFIAGKGYTWVNFQCKYLPQVDQFWVQINTALINKPLSMGILEKTSQLKECWNQKYESVISLFSVKLSLRYPNPDRPVLNSQ
jgi:hypothetical protein